MRREEMIKCLVSSVRNTLESLKKPIKEHYNPLIDNHIASELKEVMTGEHKVWICDFTASISSSNGEDLTPIIQKIIRKVLEDSSSNVND